NIFLSVAVRSISARVQSIPSKLIPIHVPEHEQINVAGLDPRRGLRTGRRLGKQPTGLVVDLDVNARLCGSLPADVVVAPDMNTRPAVTAATIIQLTIVSVIVSRLIVRSVARACPAIGSGIARKIAVRI